MSAAGVLLAAMAAGTVGGQPAGRAARAGAWRRSGGSSALALPMAGGVALAATATGRLELLGAALLVPGATLGALFASVYVLADRLAPAGSATRTFAWLVTANNGGLALGAAAAGALVQRSGADGGAVVRRRPVRSPRSCPRSSGIYVRTRTRAPSDGTKTVEYLRRNRFTKRQGIATTGGWVMSHWKS